MKKLLLLLLVGLLGIQVKAQDPQLFENDWYVQEVVIENLDHYPPSGFVGRILFFNDHIEVVHPDCEEGFFSYCIYINNDVFTIDDGGVIDIGICSDPDKIFFMEQHYFVYYDWDIAKNPFNYTIESDNDLLVLTVSNMDGDQAIYINEQLSISEFNESNFSIIPNPVSDILKIENTSNNEITSIRLYDVLGRNLMTVNEGFNQIDVSHLNSGVLFVEINTEQGVITKKIIKE